MPSPETALSPPCIPEEWTAGRSIRPPPPPCPWRRRTGWGHQLGMSQYGANAMARRGMTYEQIIEFYFPGVNVARG